MSLKKRAVRVAVPLVFLFLGVTLYAAIPSGSKDCGNPGLLIRVMNATGIGRIKLCEVIPQQPGAGEICAKNGHPCNVGNGPGRCQTLVFDFTGVSVCECQ
jgi:hypothetical protein